MAISTHTHPTPTLRPGAGVRVPASWSSGPRHGTLLAVRGNPFRGYTLTVRDGYGVTEYPAADVTACEHPECAVTDTQPMPLTYPAARKALRHSRTYAEYIEVSTAEHVARGHYTQAHAMAATLGSLLTGNDGE
jgi:hypothetical protein